MRADDIPFSRYLGLKEKENKLFLEPKDTLLNHIHTLHAGAQFTLAETQSGLYLQTLFPELESQVIAILRESKMRYKKPAILKR
jgi:acyl-coenzyme A thioesterase PaaI-like protein